MLIVRARNHMFSYMRKLTTPAVDNTVPHAFPNLNRVSPLDPSAAMASNDPRSLDYRLEEVINQYGAQSSGPHDEIQDGTPNVMRNEEIASIADDVTRMPVDSDPPLWIVRVRVSPTPNSAIVGTLPH